MTAWAKETVPAKGLIVKFEGLFSFVGTNKTGQGQGTRLNLNYAEAAEFGTADYTWKASENKTKTLSFKYGSNNLLLEKWWQVVGGRDDDESKKCLPCGGSFVAISGGFGATLWSWNIFDADRFDAHVRTAVEWAPKEVPTLLEETLDAILGKHVLASSTTHVSGINWTLAEAVDGITVENNTITLRDATLDGTTIKLTATVDTYTVTVERKVLWVNPPAATVTQALAAEADTVISVEGLFVGVADEGNGYQKEILLKDPANDNLIAVQGTNYGEWPTVGYTKGDLVRLVVNVKHKATGNKTYLEFIEGNNPTNVAETIVSSGNAVTYNLDNVVTLENWDAWKTTFVVDTLPMYTYIRIKGTVYLNKLNSTSSASGGVTLYRPHMNPAPTNLTGMKPDGTRAIGFRENVLKANLGSTTWSTYFSGKTWSTSYTFTDTKYQKEVDIIAVYTNANGVNFMLTILEADWLK